MEFSGIDDEGMDDIIINSCATCKHLHTDSYDPPATCEAFPAGIPDEIFNTGSAEAQREVPVSSGRG
jgi:hypothetical protein